MTSRTVFVEHIFAGGWNTDAGPRTSAQPQIQGNTGIMQIPYLLEADNVIYDLQDGGPHKAPGTSKLNSSALESGADVTGLFDYWISGTGGSSTQHRVIHVGTKIKKDDADGSFSDIFTGLESGKVPSYSVLEDLLVMSTNSSADVPKSWDGSTAQDLAGSPPNFSFSTTHKNKMWAAGVPGNPSRLYYSVSLDPADWASSGSGSIDIDPDDGDRIVGLISHKNDLWVFKGPYKQSIHRITGSAPTGGDAYARIPFVYGITTAAHRLLFRFGDDVGFMAPDGTVTSLSATAAFGDFRAIALSRDIQTGLREHVNFAALNTASAVPWPELGINLFALPVDTSTVPNRVYMMDFRFSPVRWAPWPDFTPISLALVVDSSNVNRQVIMEGGPDGFVRKYGQASRSIDGDSAISYKVTTPYLTYGASIMTKTIGGASVGISPKNDGTFTFGWTRDNNTQQTKTFNQMGGDVLAPASANQFTLGTSTLGGARFLDIFKDLEEGGDFRAINYEITHNTNKEDLEIHSIGAEIEGDSWSYEN